MDFEFPDDEFVFSIATELLPMGLELVGEELISFITEGVKLAIDETGAPAEFKNYVSVLFNSSDDSSISLQIQVNHPAAQYFNDGVTPQLMTWLQGKTIAFTPKGATEQIIRFGNVGETNSQGGVAWYHPGIKAKNFIDRGVEIGLENFIAGVE